jgi:nitrous oxidase accessory protein NosD
MFPRTLAAAGLLAALAMLPAPVRAETLACTTITSLPAVISSPGVYCLRDDLSTNLAGSALSIDASDVTLDCNGHKIGGLAAGTSANNSGIVAVDNDQVLVRRCNVRGFRTGIYLTGNGNAVEDSRIEGSRDTAIYFHGSESVARGNLILDTGFHVTDSGSIGILLQGTGMIVDNTIDTVVAQAGSGANATGISISNAAGSLVAGNRVRGLAGDGVTGYAITIYASAPMSIRDNVAMGIAGYAINCSVGDVAAGNHVSATGVELDDCTDGGGNMTP